MCCVDDLEIRSVVTNVVIKYHTAAHIMLPRIHPSVTTSSGAFLDSIDVLYVVLTPQKATGEVVTDGWIRGGIICGEVWYLMTTFVTVVKDLIRKGPGFRVQGSGFRVQGSGSRVQGSGFRVQGPGFRVQGSEFRVQGSGFRI